MKRIIAGLFSLILIAVSINGCAVTRKISAASLLQNVSIEYNEMHLDSVQVNPDLFEKNSITVKTSLLPNPQVITLVQNLARGIIESELGKAYLSTTLIANSRNEDSLWIRNCTATLFLDSLMELPLTLQESSILRPGENIFTISTQFPIDKRLFRLKEVNKYRIKGVLNVSLESDGEIVPLEFDIAHDISQEEINALEDRAREFLLNGLVSDWVGAILPNE